MHTYPLELVDPSVRWIGYLDQALVTISIDIRLPYSCLNAGSPMVQRLGDADYSMHLVWIPRIQSAYDARPISFRRLLLDAVDVTLGRDWADREMNAKYTARIPYVDRLFDIRHTSSSILNEDFMAVRIELFRHGVTAGNADNEDSRTLLLLHLLFGRCASPRSHAGCQDILSQTRLENPRALVRYIVTRLKSFNAAGLPRDRLSRICRILPGHRDEPLDSYALCYEALERYLSLFEGASGAQEIDFNTVETLDAQDLQIALFAHGIYDFSQDIGTLKNTLYTHLSKGRCGQSVWASLVLDNQQASHSGCLATYRATSISIPANSGVNDRSRQRMLQVRLKLVILERCLALFNRSQLKRLLRVLNVASPSDRTNDLASRLRQYIAACQEEQSPGPDLVTGPPWPAKVSDATKDRLIRNFRNATGKNALQRFVCGTCAKLFMVSEGMTMVPLPGVDLGLLAYPGVKRSGLDRLPLADLLSKVAIDRRGAIVRDGITALQLCNECHRALISRRTLPALSLANGLLLGDVPSELEGLTPVEESLIALCRAKCWIVQLKETEVVLPTTQRALRGHVLIFPQNPERIASVFPPTVEEITTYICIVFVGSSRPTDQWIRDNAKPLYVRREKVRRALDWLRRHNKLYQDIQIDIPRLQKLPCNGVLPFPVHRQDTGSADGMTTSTYDPAGMDVDPVGHNQEHEREVIFDSVAIIDVEKSASTTQLRDAALKHLVTGKGWVEVRHGTELVNEFGNPSLFPAMYPTLFPFGIGGFEDPSRKVAVSLERHVRHLLSLADRRFQVHHSFIFAAFNILQRRQALLHTKFRVSAPRFEMVAKEFSEISLDTVKRVTARAANGEPTRANDPEEESVLRLMKEVKMVTRNVWGSAQSRRSMRDELRALMISVGMPSYFVTINPADIHNPLINFLAGADIDIDHLLPEQRPSSWSQAILVAQNPIVSAQFFNLYIKAFVKHLLGFGSDDQEVDHLGGTLGRVKGYYGCVEAQGRGTLHCHFLIWVEGALNPNEIRDRIVAAPEGIFTKDLIEMLDDTISNYVPDPSDVLCKQNKPGYHPCSTRGVDLDCVNSTEQRQNDMYYLVKDCQMHTHKATCFKYWKGPPEPKECRFDLDAANVRPVTTVNTETGELTLRCLNGLVNNYNGTIMEATRNNMDIKFIGSGQSAKAVIYYVTDYISKTQLKAHVAFAALEVAVRKLGALDLDDEFTRSKRLLQKCAYAVISHQELSAQQVASYLMDYEDHFTSHLFRAFWWKRFEYVVDEMDGVGPEGVHDGSLTQPGSSTTLNIGREQFSPLMEEVLLDENDGELSPRTGLAADYILRPFDFDLLSLWDFIARTKKEPMSKQRSANSADTSMDVDLVSREGITRPGGSSHFRPLHLQSRTHRLVWRTPAAYVVPVPTGEGLPRRDKPETYDRYCKIMLILFKPWRNAADLKGPWETWTAAFNDYRMGCSPRYLNYIENMQLLHECKDSRDDHFAERRNRRRTATSIISSSWTNNAVGEDDDLHWHNTDNDILTHLQSMDESRSMMKHRLSTKAFASAQAAAEAGLFDWTDRAGKRIWPKGLEAAHETRLATNDVEILNGENRLELEWRRCYDLQREESKKRLSEQTLKPTEVRRVDIADSAPIRAVNSVPTDTGENQGMGDNIIRNIPGLPDRDALLVDTVDGQRSSSAGQIAAEYSLNPEQMLAFRLICDTAETKPSEPLRLYLGGSGGTGKSRIILAVREFFHRRQEHRRLRLTSYTGVAAHNISGSTLHSALSLSHRSSKSGTGKTRQDLIAMWEGVDFLFVDEVSMIGCQFILSIHQALTEAKSNPAPFGGINIIWAGDFAQLPPVAQIRLYAKLSTRLTARTGTPTGQKNILGKLLWLQVRDAILLHRPMRQSGSHNTAFVSLLERMRLGKCTDQDYELLKSRIGREAYRTSGETWSDVPIIVGDNASKDLLNERAAEAFSRATGSHLSWYHASNYHRNRLIEDPRLLEELSTYHSGQTGYRLGRLPLCTGMPVLLSQNYDVENGIVNGTFGTVRYVRYICSNDGTRRARSCIVRAMGYNGTKLPYLEDREIAILEDSVDLMFTHPHSGKKCKLQRHQLPLFPAFAMTVYKAQGLTFPRIIVDLESCIGIEAAYVMLSRVQSIDGLMILRPFSRSKITARQSEDSRREFKRLEMLHLKTVSVHSPNKAERTRALQDLRSVCLPSIPYSSVGSEAAEAVRLFQELNLDDTE